MLDFLKKKSIFLGKDKHQIFNCLFKIFLSLYISIGIRLPDIPLPKHVCIKAFSKEWNIDRGS